MLGKPDFTVCRPISEVDVYLDDRVAVEHIDHEEHEEPFDDIISKIYYDEVSETLIYDNGGEELAILCTAESCPAFASALLERQL